MLLIKPHRVLWHALFVAATASLTVSQDHNTTQEDAAPQALARWDGGCSTDNFIADGFTKSCYTNQNVGAYHQLNIGNTGTYLQCVAICRTDPLCESFVYQGGLWCFLKRTGGTAALLYDVDYNYGYRTGSCALLGGRVEGYRIQCSARWVSSTPARPLGATGSFAGCADLCSTDDACDVFNWDKTRLICLAMDPYGGRAEGFSNGDYGIKSDAFSKTATTTAGPTTTSTALLTTTSASCGCWVTEYYDEGLPTCQPVPVPTSTGVPALSDCDFDFEHLRPLPFRDNAYALGCYRNTMEGLGPLMPVNTSNTPWTCNDQCLARGYLISATYAGTGCVCYQMQKAPITKRLLDTECTSLCAGNSSEHCGGMSYQLNLVVNPRRNIFCPHLPPMGCALELRAAEVPPSGFKFGCFKDLVADKDLGVDESTTPASCNYRCLELGFSLSATTDSNRCGCFDRESLPNAGRVVDSECSSPCAGDAKEKCGGPAAKSLSSFVVNTAPEFCPTQPQVGS